MLSRLQMSEYEMTSEEQKEQTLLQQHAEAIIREPEKTINAEELINHSVRFSHIDASTLKLIIEETDSELLKMLPTLECCIHDFAAARDIDCWSGINCQR